MVRRSGVTEAGKNGGRNHGVSPVRNGPGRCSERADQVGTRATTFHSRKRLQPAVNRSLDIRRSVSDGLVCRCLLCTPRHDFECVFLLTFFRAQLQPLGVCRRHAALLVAPALSYRPPMRCQTTSATAATSQPPVFGRIRDMAPSEVTFETSEVVQKAQKPVAPPVQTLGPAAFGTDGLNFFNAVRSFLASVETCTEVSIGQTAAQSQPSETHLRPLQ